MGGTDYLALLKTHLVPFLKRVRADHPTKRVVFMHDGAGPHRALIVKKFLNEENIETFEAWPPNSPDLNPIENWWGYLANKCEKHTKYTIDNNPENREFLWDTVRIEASHTPCSLLDTLCHSFNAERQGKLSRCDQCIAAGGAKIDY